MGDFSYAFLKPICSSSSSLYRSFYKPSSFSNFDFYLFSDFLSVKNLCFYCTRRSSLSANSFEMDTSRDLSSSSRTTRFFSLDLSCLALFFILCSISVSWARWALNILFFSLSFIFQSYFSFSRNSISFFLRTKWNFASSDFFHVSNSQTILYYS